MRSILKQTTWLILAQVLTKIIGFFYTIFLAKSLGVEDFGLLIVALAYFSIISSIADFGFNRFLIREVTRDKGQTNVLLWNTVMLRLTLTSILFAVFAVFIYFFDADKIRVNLILLATLAILPQTVGMTFDGIFIALKKLQFSSLALFLSTLATALVGLFLVSRGFGPTGAVNALIYGQLTYVIILFSILTLNHGLHFPKIEVYVIKKAIKGSLPYGILGILGLLYFRIDAIILSYIRGSFEAGIYGAAYKFLEAIIFVPSSFAAALFPALAKLHNNKIEMKQLYFKSIKLMLSLGLFFLLGYIFVLPQIIKIFLPNYLPAIEAIKILSLSIPFIFIATPGVQVLLSTDKYLKSVVFFSIFTLVFNITLNFLFIPKFGFIAASWVTVFSDILSFVIFFLLIKFKMFGKKS